MAKRVKAADAAKTTNGFDGDKIRQYIGKIENLHSDMESEKGAYMSRCKKIRGSIDVIYEEAKALGLPKKVLKAHFDLRVLEARKSALVGKLNDDDVETFEAVADALGDFATLPLGVAAVQRTKPTQADNDALKTLN